MTAPAAAPHVAGRHAAPRGFVLPLGNALGALPLPPTAAWPDGVFDREVFARHNVTVSVFAPAGTDRQGPHARDELYVVVAGTATLDMDGARRAVAPGDLIFVPAGAAHRFEDLAADFATWVVFFGPSTCPSTCPST